MRVTIVFLIYFLLIKIKDVTCDLRNCLFEADQNAQHFLSWLTQFSYTETGNFLDDFIPLNEMCSFDIQR